MSERIERHVSGSEFKTFRRCRRRWMIEYVWRLTIPKADPGALGVGILTHAGLETITSDGTVDEAKQAILLTASAALDDLNSAGLLTEEAHELWMEGAADAQNYVEGYVEWLISTGADQRYVTYAAEEEVSMPLMELMDPEGNLVAWVLKGKMDRRMYDRFTERHVFMDYKTTGRFEDIEEAAYRNEQFPTYELLLRYKYPDERCGSGVWRMLRKVKRAKDGDGEFFRDYIASYNDKVMQAVFIRYKYMVGEMHMIENEIMNGNINVAYPSPDFRCAWDCPYKHECTMFDDGSRVLDAIQDQYVEFDPYARYTDLKGE